MSDEAGEPAGVAGVVGCRMDYAWQWRLRLQRCAEVKVDSFVVHVEEFRVNCIWY